MRSHITTSSEGRSIIVLFDENGDIATINESHPNFVRIHQAVRNGEDPSSWLNSNTDWFEAEYLDDFDFDGFCDDDEDGEFADDFDPAPVVENLSDTIERYRREGRDATNLVRFMRRLSKNPSFRSREQLFQWTQAKDMTVDPDGYLIGYKGVTRDMLSINSGTAFVDGVEHNGRIPNLVGTVVSMPRSEVQDDPTIGCSNGLHVGSWDYASGFGEVTLEVRIDPADVVSVPVDCGFQKLRCCEYEIVAVHDTDTDDLSAHEPDATWSEEEAFDSFVEYVPAGFLARLRDRVLRKDKS